MSTGGNQQIAVVREVLRGIGAAAGIDDGREIVGAEMPLDELARRLLDDGGAERTDVDIVQHQHVDAPVERPRIRAHVCADGTTEHGEPIRALDRQLDVRKHFDLLRLSVLEDLEVLTRQAGDEVALLVGDDRVDVDVVHLDLKGHRRGRLRLCDGRAEARHYDYRSAGLQAGLRGEQCDCRDERQTSREMHGSSHYIAAGLPSSRTDAGTDNNWQTAD